MISNLRTQDYGTQDTCIPKETKDALWTAIDVNKDLEDAKKALLYHLLLEYKDILAHNQVDLGRTGKSSMK